MSGDEGPYNDTVFGGSGADKIYGESGDDELHGGSGSDLLDGGFGDDDLFGDSGNDTMVGGDGCDRLAGGGGNDVMTGDGGFREVPSLAAVSGGDSDVFVFASAGGNDTITDFQVGVDRLEFIGTVKIRTVATRDVNGDTLLDTVIGLTSGSVTLLNVQGITKENSAQLFVGSDTCGCGGEGPVDTFASMLLL